MSDQDFLITDAQIDAADDFWAVEVTELFSNDVPHVKGERVIKPTGMPPADWSLS
jgi:hypothetical protein